MAKRHVAVDDRPLFIIGVDPGKATGIGAYTSGKIVGRIELPADEVAEYLAMNVLPALHSNRVIIGVERYVFGVGATRKTRQNDPARITGQLEDLARRFSAELHMVNQADSKRLASDATLKKLGWWVRDPAGHMNDGVRVVLTTLAQLDVTEFTRVYESVIE